jgi:hypothetical protein
MLSPKACWLLNNGNIPYLYETLIWCQEPFTMVQHAGPRFQKFDENDLFTSAAAMSYFGLLTLFALLLLLAVSNRTRQGRKCFRK